MRLDTLDRHEMQHLDGEALRALLLKLILEYDMADGEFLEDDFRALRARDLHISLRNRFGQTTEPRAGALLPTGLRSVLVRVRRRH